MQIEDTGYKWRSAKSAPGRTAVIADQPAEHEEDENTHIEDDKSGNITEHLAGRVVKFMQIKA